MFLIIAVADSMFFGVLTEISIPSVKSWRVFVFAVVISLLFFCAPSPLCAV